MNLFFNLNKCVSPFTRSCFALLCFALVPSSCFLGERDTGAEKEIVSQFNSMTVKRQHPLYFVSKQTVNFFLSLSLILQTENLVYFTNLGTLTSATVHQSCTYLLLVCFFLLLFVIPPMIHSASATWILLFFSLSLFLRFSFSCRPFYFFLSLGTFCQQEKFFFLSSLSHSLSLVSLYVFAWPHAAFANC